MIVFLIKDAFLFLLSYTPREPVILPFKPINRPLKTDWYNGTTYNRPNTVGHGMVN